MLAIVSLSLALWLLTCALITGAFSTGGEARQEDTQLTCPWLVTGRRTAGQTQATLSQAPDGRRRARSPHRERAPPGPHPKGSRWAQLTRTGLSSGQGWDPTSATAECSRTCLPYMTEFASFTNFMKLWWNIFHTQWAKTWKFFKMS